MLFFLSLYYTFERERDGKSTKKKREGEEEEEEEEGGKKEEEKGKKSRHRERMKKQKARMIIRHAHQKYRFPSRALSWLRFRFVLPVSETLSKRFSSNKVARPYTALQSINARRSSSTPLVSTLANREREREKGAASAGKQKKFFLMTSSVM